MNTLVFERNPARFAAARLAAAFGSGRGAGVGPLRLVEADAPDDPGPGWHRVQPLLAGICGSDLSTVDGRSSRYFEELVSFPFVPGHEIVGTVSGTARTAGGTELAAGSRVVVEPVLGCRARRIDPPCPACAAGRTGNCERASLGHLRPGLQTGYCADTGGGWSSAGLWAHESQLHPVPDALGDADAVMVEPLACGLHAARAAPVRDDDTVAVLGAGTLGLAVTAALARPAGGASAPAGLVVGARYPHQRRWAAELGASEALAPDQLGRAVRRRRRTLAVGAPTAGSQRLTGGADIVFDCVGSATSLESALAIVRPRGRVVLVGMPGRLSVDLAGLWHREVQLSGAYAYGLEETVHGPVRTFDLAFALAAEIGAGRLVTATYPIERFEEALAHAGSAGRRGAVKIAFDLTASERARPEARRTSTRTARSRKGPTR